MSRGKHNNNVYKDGKPAGKRIWRLINIVSFIVSYCVLFFAVLGVIYLSSHWENIRTRFSVETWSYTLGLPEDSYYNEGTVSSDVLYKEGIVYLNMSDIAVMCNMTVVGDFSSLTYFVEDNSEQTATFYYGSDSLTVNGEHFKMNGSMFEHNGSVYVPVTFISRFCSGIIVELDSDKQTVHLYRHSLGVEYNPLDEPYHIYEDVLFFTGGLEPLEMPDRGLMFSTNNGEGPAPDSEV